MTNWRDDTEERDRDFEIRRYEQPDPEPEPREQPDVLQDRAETREAE